MGIAKGYFKTVFSKLNIQQTKGGVAVSLNLERLGKKIDIAQDALDAQVWSDMKQYMPHDTGNLIADTERLNQSTRGEVYKFDPASDYGHYQYEGILYVDPVYNVGAFYDPAYGYWSRPGIEKIPSERKLEYTQPQAVSHWDEEAARKHKKEWINVAKRSVR